MHSILQNYDRQRKCLQVYYSVQNLGFCKKVAEKRAWKWPAGKSFSWIKPHLLKTLIQNLY